MERRRFLKLGLAGITTITSMPSTIVIAEQLNNIISQKLGAERADCALLKRELTPNTCLLGFAPQNNELGRIESFATVGQSPVSVVHLFADWNKNDWAPDTAKKVVDSGRTALISLNPWSSGRFDMDRFQKSPEVIAAQLADFKNMNNVIFRFWYEMNGMLTPNVQPDDYIKTFKTFFDAVKSLNPNIKCMWCPYITVFGKDFMPYYPGDDYVDIIGIDGYDEWKESRSNIKHYVVPNLSPSQIFGKDIAILQQLIPHKPLIIAETGSARGLKSGAWLAELLKTIPLWKNVNGIILFGWNMEGQSLGDENWDPANHPDVLRSINEILRDSTAYYKGTSPGATDKILVNSI